jgi:hypothetical protein
MGIVEVEGQRDRVTEVSQGLVGRHLDLPPDLGRPSWGVVTPQDAHPEGIDGGLRLPSAGIT